MPFFVEYFVLVLPYARAHAVPGKQFVADDAVAPVEDVYQRLQLKLGAFRLQGFGDILGGHHVACFHL